MPSESIVWSAIVRDETLLVQSRTKLLSDEILDVARGLLNKPSTVGFDTCGKPWSKYKGLRFHVYQETEDTTAPRIWIFCCVFGSGCSKRQAQSYLEKICMITELFRETDETWKTGDHHSCEELFAPILEQRMLEMSYLKEMAMVEDKLELSSAIIAKNREILEAQRIKEHYAKEEKKVEEEMLLKQMEEMNRMIEQAGGLSSSISSPTARGSKKRVPSTITIPEDLPSLNSSVESESLDSEDDSAPLTPIRVGFKRLACAVKKKTSHDEIEDTIAQLEREARQEQPVKESESVKEESNMDYRASAIAAGVVLAFAVVAAAVIPKHGSSN